MGKDVADLVDAIIYVYTTRHLKKSDKVRFYYALKGRDGTSGFLQRYAIEQLAKTVLLVSKKRETAVEEFLHVWNCKFKKTRVYIERR